jgi:hypothetical protein
MANTASPYGLRPINRVDGMPYAGATETFLIDPAGEATNISMVKSLLSALMAIWLSPPLLALTSLPITLVVPAWALLAFSLAVSM